MEHPQVDLNGRPLYDAGEPSDVRKARKDARRAAVVDDNAIRHMLGNEQQRKLMWDFLSGCGLFEAVCFAQQGDMYFRAGERNAALRWMAIIPADLYLLMSNEHKERNDVR